MKRSTIVAVLVLFSIWPVYLQAQSDQLAFSSLLERGTDANSMAFNSDGDVYFIGWSHGLERALVSELPDGTSEPLIPKADYGQVFQPSGREIVDINGKGVAFDSKGVVISFHEEVYRAGESGIEAGRLRFVRFGTSTLSISTTSLSAIRFIRSPSSSGMSRRFRRI